MGQHPRAGAGAGLYRCTSAPVRLVAGFDGGHAGRPVRQQSQPVLALMLMAAPVPSSVLLGASRSELAELERRWWLGGYF